jgi:ElaB/YqjD/DUF883 family membrane-anchored ribosome-binding protein
MTDPKTELLQIIANYEAAARVLPGSSPDAASYYSALRPTIESAMRCLERLAQAVSVRSRADVERFRQVVGQARNYLKNALADMYEHTLVCIYDLLRGIKNLLQDLVHNRLLDEDLLLAFDRKDLLAILAHLKFPPRKGSRLRAAFDSI